MGCYNSKLDTHIITLMALFLSYKKVQNEWMLQHYYDAVINYLSNNRLHDGIYVILLNLLWNKILSITTDHQLEQTYSIIKVLSCKFESVFHLDTEIVKQQSINQNTRILLENIEKIYPVEYLEIVQFYGLRYNNKILAIKYFSQNPELNIMKKSCNELIIMLLVITSSIRNKQINLYGVLFLLKYFYIQIPTSNLKNKLFDFLKKNYKDCLFIQI